MGIRKHPILWASTQGSENRELWLSTLVGRLTGTLQYYSVICNSYITGVRDVHCMAFIAPKHEGMKCPRVEGNKCHYAISILVLLCYFIPYN